MKNYKIWITAIILFTGLLGVNEYLLHQSRHLKSLVNDEELWSIHRRKVESLDKEDIVLLGASRMQTNVNLKLFKEKFPGRTIIQLAVSGGHTSLPVFKDIIDNTDFKGTLIISETESSMAAGNSSQDDFVNFYHNQFSIDRQWNKQIENWILQNVLFLNPNSSSERLWGNILVDRELPEPVVTKTLPDRQLINYFELMDTTAIWNRRMNGIKNQKSFSAPGEWLEKTISLWKPKVEVFKKRGGELIFIRMPVDVERWTYESKLTPTEKYWDRMVQEMGIKAIHFTDYPKLCQFRLPDTSHLDSDDRDEFTESLVEIINNYLE